MTSFKDADSYPTTLAGQLLKLCNESTPGASRQRMATLLVNIYDAWEKDPENNNPTNNMGYFCDSCQWFRIPVRRVTTDGT